MTEAAVARLSDPPDGSCRACTFAVWHYSGMFSWTEDLSLLEANLIAGRSAAVVQGFQNGPDEIHVTEVMLIAEKGRFLSALEAFQAGIRFSPTDVIFVMTWHSRHDQTPTKPTANSSRGRIPTVRISPERREFRVRRVPSGASSR